jgi:lipopolysaccharide transport system permease protein
MLKVIKEMLAYRALIQTLVVRDLKSRYRGSALGLLWTLLNPLLFVVIYVLVFSVYLRIDMENYPAFLLAGVLPWQWLGSSLTLGASAIVDGGHLLKKVFFPPQILPTVGVLVNLVNFLLGLPLLFALVLLLGVKLGWALLLLPVIILAQLAFTEGLTLIVSTVSVRYRDIPHMLAHVLTFWFFLSPILYPPSQVPASLRPILVLNPFTPFANAYQGLLLWDTLPSWPSLAVMLALGISALWMGAVVFERLRWVCVEEI